MNFTLNQLKCGNLLDFELRKESRNLTGYTLYLSFFYRDWKTLGQKERLDILDGDEEEAGQQDGYTSDYDSVDSIHIDNAMVIRYAAKTWNRQSVERQKSWGIRAQRLNSQPILGKFISVPSIVNNALICDSLTMEWRHVCRVLKSTLSRDPTRIMSQKSYAMSFSGVRQQVGTQSFRRAYMPMIIRLCVFGDRYSKLHPDEIIVHKKKTAVIHICSRERICNLFTQYHMCASEFIRDDGIIYTCAGKISVINRNGKHMTGFIMSERRNRWVVKLNNNKEVVLQRVRRDADGYIYDTNDCNHGEGEYYRITQYWPICIKFILGCQNNFQLLLCRVALKDNSKKIVTQLSS